MSSLLRAALAAVAAVALLAAPAAAHPDRGRSDDRAKVPRTISAEAFLTKAAAANRFEIITGQLAQERASSDAVKALGAELVADHTAALAQGTAVAQQLGITVPETLTRRQRRAIALLERLEGRRFDRAWIAVQLWAHQKSLALHLRGATRGENEQIRTLAQAGLPIIAKHIGHLFDIVEAAGDGHRGHRPHGALV